MKIQSVSIIGAGTMGGGIAISCMAAGLKTRVIDTNADGLAAMQKRITRFFDRKVEKAQMRIEDASHALSCLSVSQDIGDTSGADLIIEAIFEDLQVKRDLFEKLSGHLGADTIVATNTSALRLSDLASALPNPERFLGLHYFSPAEINPIVELIAGQDTSPDVLSSASAFLEDTAKTTIQCKDASGFAINRFFCPYTNEAVRILDDGLANTAQIDQIACDTFGLALGPFAVMNIIKPRINLNAVQNLSGLGPFYEPADGLKRVGATEENWPIASEADELTEIQAQIIRDRLMGAVFFPVLQAIEENVAAPSDFDKGARLALRFERPPVALMKELGRDRVTQLVSDIAKAYQMTLPQSALNTVFA
ncbi:3-hydroxyacyl-CoA dehydrogenase family protein [Ruegeria jejuensis]|uniref:3-hydroxyacyl-CoA dehydrogenase family protein n=1 Tax=Ruegeria jejuensis TaxID=3233338 RepID=UPI00355C520C